MKLIKKLLNLVGFKFGIITCHGCYKGIKVNNMHKYFKCKHCKGKVYRIEFRVGFRGEFIRYKEIWSKD